MRRVVITGCGCIVPGGNDILSVWDSILNGASWIKKNLKINTDDLRSKVCSSVTIDEAILEKYDSVVGAKDKRRMDDVEYVSLIASYNAMQDCGLLDNENFNKENFGTFIASGIGGIKSIQDCAQTFLEKGYRRISPFFLTSSLTNMCAGNVAIKFGLQGASMAHVSACASSTHSIGEAFNYIRSGRLDGCLAGGSEMSVCEIGVGGFDSMHALSSNFNDTPEKASRPLDKDRDGFVIGEGSVILMLEELEHAKRRNAKIYCEVVGYGATCDAYHITSPRPDGKGAGRAMQLAINDANISVNDIDYINLHGTSTQLGDIAEISAIKDIFSKHAYEVPISSTKSITGHLLGATGALEAMICAKSCQEQILPPSINIQNLDENCQGMNVIQKATKHDIKYAMSNSFGFGGTNGCLVFKTY